MSRVTDTRVVLVLVLLLSFFAGLGSTPLFDLDEGAFSEATREMFERQDFISTYLNGVPRYDKPILVYWLQAASTSVFGFTEFGFRLPSALSGCLWVLALFFFLRRLRDESLALHGALVAAMSIAVSVICKAATADALLNMLLACSMFSMFLYYRERRLLWLLALFAFSGLGFLTKGPVAILVPVAVSFIFCAVRKEWRLWFNTVFHPLGIGVFLAIAMPWYVLQYMKEGQAFIDGFFLKHNVSRFQGPMEQHGGSIFYYIPIVLIGIVPFTSVALKALRKVKDYLHEDLMLFALIWFLFVLGFFSLSGTKLPHYVNYGLTGLFILTAAHMTQVRNRMLVLLPALLALVALLFIPEIVAASLAGIKDPFLADGLASYEQFFTWQYRLYFSITCALVVFFMFYSRLPLPAGLYLSAAFLVLGLSWVLMPRVGAMIQQPVKEAAHLAREQDLNVVMWRINVPSFSVYRQGITPRIQTPQAGQTILTKKQHLQKLGLHELHYSKGGLVLLTLKKNASEN